MDSDNIILIGMPASGKSTAGVLLAKTTGRDFIDTDLLIQKEQGSLLCDIIARKGAEKFIEIEEGVLSSLCVRNSVIATGGSAVYGDRAMKHLRAIGTVVYLHVAEEVIETRLQNIVLRGVVTRKRGETVAELYAERAPLYEKYADITVDCGTGTVEQTVQAIVRAIAARDER